MKQPTDVLRKYDYSVIRYAADLQCPNGDMSYMEDKPNLVGWCETPIGHMMVLECPICGKKFRYHASDHWDDTVEEFNASIIKRVKRQRRFSFKFFNNGEELANLFEL